MAPRHDRASPATGGWWPAMRLSRAWTPLMALLALGTLGAGACQAGATPLPPRPPHVDVAMDEMSFDHPDTLPAGRIVLEIENVGDLEHRLILIRLPDDFPPIQEQIRGDERRRVAPLAGIPDLPPGAHKRLAADLEPGRYALVCMHEDPDGVTHAEKGMASEFQVRES